MAEDLVINDVARPNPIEGFEAPIKKRSGWEEESRTGRKRLEDSLFGESEAVKGLEDTIDDIPVIPDIEDLQEEEVVWQVSAPPSVTVNRVATFKQLEADLDRQSEVFLLDEKIDLKLLAKYLSPASEVTEDDVPWSKEELLIELQDGLQDAVLRSDTKKH